MTNPYFWPGTNIVKSLDNAFNWRRGTSQFLDELRMYVRQSKAGALGGQATRKISAARDPITTYSKARPSQFTPQRR